MSYMDTNCCLPEQLTFWIAASISEEMRRGRTLVLHLRQLLPTETAVFLGSLTSTHMSAPWSNADFPPLVFLFYKFFLILSTLIEFVG